MLGNYIRFMKRLSFGKTGKAGSVLLTTSFIIFVLVELARITGIIVQAKIGLINYMVFPAVFSLGVFLLVLSWFRQKKRSGKTIARNFAEQFDDDKTKAGFWGSYLALQLSVFILLSIIFVAVAWVRMFAFMEEPVFCGTACHSVMNPEWTTYNQSPHAHVKCVECHVGEGLGALIDSKINGAWQIISLSLNLYERPIPTPVHQLRPARETCEKCHWPQKFYGNKIKTIVHYDFDSLSTPHYTTLNLKIDVGEKDNKAGIHWHISEHNTVRYVSVDEKRTEMLWVEVQNGDSVIKRYVNEEYKDDFPAEQEPARIMDCVDCHNRATHIYEDPENAIDERIKLGMLSRQLPFVKREALGALMAGYPSQIEGIEGVEDHLQSFYQRNYPEIYIQYANEIEQAVKTVQDVYIRNIHPRMNITWGSYRNFLGHRANSGCLRCHNEKMTDAEGNALIHDCVSCHSILAMDSDKPFMYLEQVKENQRDIYLHQYLQNEFFKSINE